MSKPDETQVKYGGRDTCPLCNLAFDSDKPHLVTTGGDCIKALKAENLRLVNDLTEAKRGKA